MPSSSILLFVFLVPTVSTTAAASESKASDPVATLRGVLAQPDALIDFAKAKLLFDRFLDPTINISASIKEIDEMADVARRMAGPNAVPLQKLAAVRRVIYVSGDWNGHHPFQRIVILPLLLAIVAVFSHPASSHEKVYSVCELKVLGPSLNGKYVRLAGQYETDLNHVAFFFDPACKRSLIYADEPPLQLKDKSVRKFDYALWHNAPFASLKFRMDASGKFEWQKEWQPPLDLSAVLKPRPRGVLMIQKVWRFQRLPER